MTIIAWSKCIFNLFHFKYHSLITFKKPNFLFPLPDCVCILHYCVVLFYSAHLKFINSEAQLAIINKDKNLLQIWYITTCENWETSEWKTQAVTLHLASFEHLWIFNHFQQHILTTKCHWPKTKHLWIDYCGILQKTQPHQIYYCPYLLIVCR